MIYFGRIFYKQVRQRILSCPITGSGDPWGSKIFREKLWDLDLREYPNIAMNFKTNGVMLTEKTWNKMWRIHDRVRALGVSWDACHETTYNVTRRDGDYSNSYAKI